MEVTLCVRERPRDGAFRIGGVGLRGVSATGCKWDLVDLCSRGVYRVQVARAFGFFCVDCLFDAVGLLAEHNSCSERFANLAFEFFLCDHFVLRLAWFLSIR